MSAKLEPLGHHTTVAEPGYFRTGFLSAQSVVSTTAPIEDYALNVGAVRDFARRADGWQPGDPSRLAQAILAPVDVDKPPQRVPPGVDAIGRIARKHREVDAEVDRWRHLAMSTGFVPLIDL